MNRIDRKFQELKRKQKPAFIPFITAGYPDLQTTMDLILEFEKKGADIIELGIPFSDPIADGPVIQDSYYKALDKGVKVAQIFDMVLQLRKISDIPIVSMVSYSIVYKSGYQEFVEKACRAGLDGLTIPDLPVEENDEFFELAKKYNFKLICFIAPTTTNERMSAIIQRSQGFLYYISVVGITGVRDALPDDIFQNINKIKQMTSTPICVGFGVSTPEQVKMIGKLADGVIVGSAIIKEVGKYLNTSPGELVKNVSGFVGELAKGVNI
ncbi:MAG: tryptophan synthase subunit alpha [Candidatus Loosdrechtia sp.]|uniref:tryptophan synthase subunit alpha n=1 Tax=Candidatus Loosdrechtia sp. TaxID=3101272 RepID=UPI003A7558E8|nr:MAG: tryptophan synthase subunit alpha [Candidatus Jettenia sp. AMX2]